jgi:hypothetical protein
MAKEIGKETVLSQLVFSRRPSLRSKQAKEEHAEGNT